MTTKKYWCCWGQWEAPKLCGFVICECSKLEGKIHGKISKNEKVRFETLNFIWGYCNPQKWIPGKILILLDPHNLSVRQKLTNYDIAIFANCHCHLPVLASLKMSVFDVQTSYRILPGINFWGFQYPQIKLRVLKRTFSFLDIFPCISPSILDHSQKPKP